MPDRLEYLQRAQDQGLLVPFVGAGLGAAAGLPSWPDLLERGLEYAATDRAVDPADPRLDEARALAASGADDALLDAFEVMRDVLVSGLDPCGVPKRVTGA